MRFEVLRIAFAALRANILRSLLTMLGIVIGVAAVIAMIALGDGAQKSVRDRIASSARRRCRSTQRAFRRAAFRLNVTKRMTIDDVRAIEERSPHVLGRPAAAGQVAAAGVGQQEHEHRHLRRHAELSRRSQVRDRSRRDVHVGRRHRSRARRRARRRRRDAPRTSRIPML